MADKLFEVDGGVRVGLGYWFSSNGNISIPGTISAGARAVTGETSVTNISYENTVTQQATNFSTANAWIAGGAIGVGVSGAVSPVANVYTTLRYASSFSSPNVWLTSGSLTGFTGAATTLVATNFSSGNIYQSAADTFVATNFSSGNSQITEIGRAHV